ncbi:MAG: hypothetical protein L6R00_04845 [Phycisphaerae bacterium]|nr:hypothetical protein [Phycisphaerae bacterium]
MSRDHDAETTAPRAAPLERAVLCCLPAFVLLTSFVAICVHVGSPWPWNRVAHEDGVRTLLQTIFYFEHAARELPLDLLMGVAAAAAALTYRPRAIHWTAAARRRRHEWLDGAAAAAVATVLATLIGCVAAAGFDGLIDNLSQMHTRAGAPLVWGAHWRYHFLCQIALMLLALALAGLRPVATARAARPADRAGLRCFVRAMLLFILFSVLFVLNREPFVDGRVLGHQARELFTHSVTTIPLALGACFFLERRVCGADAALDAPASLDGVNRPRSALRPALIALALACLIGAYLAVGVIVTDAAGESQSHSVVRLVCSHFFEHTPGYVTAPCAAAWVYLLGLRPPKGAG